MPAQEWAYYKLNINLQGWNGFQPWKVTGAKILRHIHCMSIDLDRSNAASASVHALSRYTSHMTKWLAAKQMRQDEV